MAETNTIEWHKQNLYNRRKYAMQLTDQMNSLKEQIERLDRENAFHQHQIRQAEKQGKKKFDADRFCVPRNKQVD